MESILSTDFEKDLYDAAIYNLNDKHNKLRYNNFAYSIRELSRHVLLRLAPDHDVKACDWFKPDAENSNPTRTQRIKYAIQGGFNDSLLDHLGLNSKHVNKDIRNIKKMIDSLSKYTHINTDIFDIKNTEVEINSDKVLSDFKLFVEHIEEVRSSVKSFLKSKFNEHIFDNDLSDSYDSVDILAPRQFINYGLITDYEITEINQRSMTVEISGFVSFTLQYGSNSERRVGDGLDMVKEFPFQTKILYEIINELPYYKYEVEDFDVDTSSWYE